MLPVNGLERNAAQIYAANEQNSTRLDANAAIDFGHTRVTSPSYTYNPLADRASETAKGYYQSYRQSAHEIADYSDDPRIYEKNLFHATFDQIMKKPVDVKIEPHEVNEAILMNRMGVDFLKVKELNVKMEMLALAQRDIETSAILEPHQQKELIDRKHELHKELDARKTALLEGNKQDLKEDKATRSEKN